jgi:hypothetical protein
MILNTSFNRKSQPIVENPADAVKTFLSCNGDIDALFIGTREVRVKPFPLDNGLSTSDPTEYEGTTITSTLPTDTNTSTSTNTNTNADTITITITITTTTTNTNTKFTNTNTDTNTNTNRPITGTKCYHVS